MGDASSGHSETLDIPVSGGDGADHAVCYGVAVVLEGGEGVELGGSVLFLSCVFDRIL